MRDPEIEAFIGGIGARMADKADAWERDEDFYPWARAVESETGGKIKVLTLAHAWRSGWQSEDRRQTVELTLPAPVIKAPEMSPVAREIFDRVLLAMQDAEEIGGPEGDDYDTLQRAIAAEALARAENYKT